MGTAELLSVYLMDYEKIRDEICMRITQRHQFTSFSLVLFAAIVSAVGLGTHTDSRATTSLASLPRETLLLVLLSPVLFYSMLLAHARHDHYITLMTMYIEKQIAAPIRELFRGQIATPLNMESLLSWERHAQRYRAASTSNESILIDMLMKYSPYFVPICTLVIIGIASTVSVQLPIPIQVLAWMNVAVVLIAAYALFRMLKRDQIRRAEEMVGY
jgi:hypothetical protein